MGPCTPQPFTLGWTDSTTCLAHALSRYARVEPWLLTTASATMELDARLNVLREQRSRSGRPWAKTIC